MLGIGRIEEEEDFEVNTRWDFHHPRSHCINATRILLDTIQCHGILDSADGVYSYVDSVLGSERGDWTNRQGSHLGQGTAISTTTTTTASSAATTGRSSRFNWTRHFWDATRWRLHVHRECGCLNRSCSCLLGVLLLEKN